jgi:hypothetical protein
VRAAFLGLVAAVCACSPILGIEELPRRADAIGEPAECRTCSEQSCRPVREACLNDPACREVYACAAACVGSKEGPVCRSKCERAVAANGAAWKALDDCRRINCTDECYGITGFGVTADAACACSDDICAPFIRRCIRSGDGKTARVGDCERRFACIGQRARPVDPDDAISCTYEERGGQDELQLVRFCWQGAACGTCPVASGKMFECTGKYQWSRPNVEQVPYTLQMNDRRGRGVAGAKVLACGTADCEMCKTPLDEGTTDSNGFVHLKKLSTFGGGFRGCFQIDAAGYLPAMWFLGRPVTREEWLQRNLVVTLADVELLANNVGAKLDMSLGQVMIGARDCLVTPASGVTIDPPTTPGSFIVYFRGSETTKNGPTDDTGQVAIGNVQPGPFTAIMRDSKGIELGRATMRIRAGWTTGVYVFPSPIPDGSL